MSVQTDDPLPRVTHTANPPCRHSDAAAHLGVLDKALEAVHKVCPVEGVATDAHHCRLAEPLLRGLEHGLRQGGEAKELQLSQAMQYVCRQAYGRGLACDWLSC